MQRPGPKLDVRQLPLESQNAYEILETLRANNEREARFKIMGQAGATDPLQVKSLANVAAHFASLGMALDQQGLQQFKADRGLVGGTGIGLPIALSYARALDGDEVLIRVSRADEAAMTPNEKATLAFFRTFQRKRTAVDLRPLKDALGLKNPPVAQGAWNLGNEFVGPTTVKQVAKASAMHGVALGPELVPTLVAKLKAAAPAAAAKPRGKPPPNPIPKGTKV